MITFSKTKSYGVENFCRISVISFFLAPAKEFGAFYFFPANKTSQFP